MILFAALLLAGAGQTQLDMDRAAGLAHQRADAAMNVQYRATMARMRTMDGYHAPDAQTGPSYENALLASQRAWLKFRDAECVIEGYQFRGGSAQPMAQSQCLADVTKQRTQQLKMLARSPDQ